MWKSYRAIWWWESHKTARRPLRKWLGALCSIFTTLAIIGSGADSYEFCFSCCVHYCFACVTCVICRRNGVCAFNFLRSERRADVTAPPIRFYCMCAYLSIYAFTLERRRRPEARALLIFNGRSKEASMNCLWWVLGVLWSSKLLKQLILNAFSAALFLRLARSNNLQTEHANSYSYIRRTDFAGEHLSA